MSKKMWHCKICGSTQDAKDTVCKSCGTDLVIYGDIVFIEGQSDDTPKPHVCVDPPVGGGGFGGYSGGTTPPVNGGFGSGYSGGVTPPVGGGGFGGYSGGTTPPVNGGFGSGYSGGVTPPVGGGGTTPPDNGGTNGGGKKGLIAIIAVLVVVIAAVAVVLGINMNKSDDKDTTARISQTTTTKPTTTKPTTTKPTTTNPTTTKPSTKAYIPEFADYAEEHVISNQNHQKLDGKSVYYCNYIVEPEMCVEVIASYMTFLEEDYSFSFSEDEIFQDSDSDVGIVGQYTGSADVGQITYTLDDGTVYSGELIIFIDDDYSATSAKIMMYYDDDFSICSTGKRTDVTAYDPDAAVLPDYEKFADGKAELYDSEYDSEEDIYTVWYEVNASDYSYVVDEYIDLLEDKYAYSLNDSYGDYSWVGMAYTGTESIGTIITTFPDGEEYEGHSVSIDVDYYDDCILVEISYVGDIELVDPVYKYEE